MDVMHYTQNHYPTAADSVQKVRMELFKINEGCWVSEFQRKVHTTKPLAYYI